jgi:monoamine oxidase
MRISFADFVARDRLPRKVSEWIRVTVEPEMAIEWDAISALDGIDEMRLFLDSPDGFGEKNYHVAGGNTRFIEALAARLKPSQITTSARVTAIERTDSGAGSTSAATRPRTVIRKEPSSPHCEWRGRSSNVAPS